MGKPEVVEIPDSPAGISYNPVRLPVDLGSQSDVIRVRS